MTPRISICYITGRRDPKFSWFVDSLIAQTTAEQRYALDVIFVDGHLWSEDLINNQGGVIDFANRINHNKERRSQLATAVKCAFNYQHVPPKPCAYQGPFRQTKRDMFCAGNSRNTAFIVARAPYVVFVDDLSVLMPGWFNQVLHAAQDGYIVAGAYKKVKNLKLTPNLYGQDSWISYDAFPSGVDSRWDRGSDGGVVPWHGSALYGCSFGLPLEAALEVDGNDAACNGQGGEDTDFGIRLERAGWPFFYNRNMLTLESEELHHDGSKLPMERRIVTPDRLPKNYDRYRIAREDEKYWSDHVMLNRLTNETDRILPIIGDNLRELRARYQATGMVPIPRETVTDWRDGTPLSEL